MANRELSLRVGVELGNTQQKLQALNNNIKLATAQFKNASAGIKNFENTTQGLQAKLKQLNTSYQQSAKKVEVLSKAIEDGSKTLAKAKDKYEENKKAIASLENALEKAKSEYGETSNEVKDLEQALEKANKELKQSETALRGADNNLNKLEKQLQDAEREAKEFANAMDETNESLSELRTESPFGDMLGDLKDIGAGFGELKGKIGAVIEVVGKLGKAFIDLGVNSVKWLGNIISKVVSFSAKLGGAVAGVSAFSVKVAGEFKAMQEQFNATFGDMSDKAIASMESLAGNTGIVVGRLQQPFTQFYAQMKSAGLESEEALKATERGMGLVADAAAYYDISLEEASERVRSFLRMNLEAGDAIGLQANEMARNEKAVELYGKKFKDLTEEQRQLVLLNIAEELYKQTGAFEQAIREADGLENVVGNLKYSFSDFIATLGENMLEPAINSMKDFSLALLDAKKELETNGLGSAIQVMVDHIVGELNKMADHIPQVMQTVIDSMVNFINSSLPSIMELGGKIVQNIATGITQNQEAISTGISEVIKQIANWINNNMPAIMEAGKTILNALSEGIQNNMPAIETAVYNVTTTAVNLFLEYKTMLFDVGLQVGAEFVSGIWEGIWKKGTERKPINDNFWTPTVEDAKVKGAETGEVWVSSVDGVLKGAPNPFDANFFSSKETFTKVQLDGENTGYAYVDGVKKKISELDGDVKLAVEQLLKTNEEKPKAEGKKAGQATAQGAKEGVQQGKEGVKGATKQVATESSKAMLDELQKLTPETYKKMLDVTQKVKESASSMYNGAKYSFSQLGKAGKEEMTSLYKGVSTSMYKTSEKVRQEASNLYNGAKTSFVNLANVAKNQFSNIYSNCSSYMDRLRRDVLSDWESIRTGLGKSITGKISVTKTTANVSTGGKSKTAPAVAVSGQYFNARTRDSRAVNNVLSPAGIQASKAETQVIKELQNNNALLSKMVEVLLSERTTVVENNITLEGRSIARGTARFIKEELDNMDTRKTRLAGKLNY